MYSSSVRMTWTPTRLDDCGNHVLVRQVFLLFDCDSKKFQSIANAAADYGRVLPDAAGKYQGVQSTQHRRECTNPFFDLIAKQRDCFRRAHILGFVVEQIAHVGTCLRYSEQAGVGSDHFVELLRIHFFGTRQIPNQSWIEIPRPSAHRHTSCRSEAHARVDRFAVAYRRETRAIAKVGENDPTGRCRRVSQAREFFHQEGVRQSVKAVPSHALCFVASRDRQELRHARHIMVKSRVEARHLG